MDNTRITTPPEWTLEPLSARSIVLSVLLGSHPPSMPVGRLLEFTALFGLADGSVRTALSRLVKAGDLDATDGTYRLSGRLEQRQAQQDAGRTPTPRMWDGTWWIAAVIAERRPVAVRREFRSKVVGARLGELRPDLWMRPANIDIPRDLPDVLVTRGPLLQGDEADLVRQMWDLDELEHSAARLLDDLEHVGATLRADVPDDLLPEAFTQLATCQRFLRFEPQLPAELSDQRTAEVLRERYDEVVGHFQAAMAEFFSRTPGRRET